MTWIDLMFALLFVLAGTGLFTIAEAVLWYAATAVAFLLSALRRRRP